MSETIEEWAAKRALQLDAEGWRWTNAGFYGDDWLEAVMPYPEGASVPELKAALLACRDRVASELRHSERAVLRHGCGRSATEEFAQESLKTRGLLAEDKQTALGVEVARVLRETLS